MRQRIPACDTTLLCSFIVSLTLRLSPPVRRPLISADNVRRQLCSISASASTEQSFLRRLASSPIVVSKSASCTVLSTVCVIGQKKGLSSRSLVRTARSSLHSTEYCAALRFGKMPAATLHSGVRHGREAARPLANDTEKPSQHPYIEIHNLGEEVAACVGEGDAGHGAAGGISAPPPRTRRSFADAVEVVSKMTSRKPNRCPDGFETTKLFLDRLGFTPILERIRFVHISGTKGKGTTSAYTAALLQAYGFKVGLFTSPHLTDVRERIVVDGRVLDETAYARYFFDFHDMYEAMRYSNSQLDRDIASPSRANFFRFMFLLSLYIFEQENVEVAVMEVGMGGRLDSTNTVPAEVSIITALGYDHMEILGNSIQEIASEKAGIMKPGVVCFAAPQIDHPETRPVLEKHAKEVDAPLILLDKDVLPIRSWPRLAIGGAHAIEDSKLALMAARRIAGIPPILPLDEVEKNVLQTMTYAGRSQIVPIDGGADVTLYLDGAHTVESISSAMEWFLEASATATDASPRRVLVFYTSREPKRILKAFMPYVSKLCKIVVAQVSNPRITSHSADPDDVRGRESEEREMMVAMAECWRNMYREVPCLPCAQPFDALEDLLDLVVPAAGDNEDASKPAQVLVCGSFFLVGDILTLIRAYEAGKRRGD
ncbi:folylpolyglutamate synthetase (FPGS) [Leptomonas seymouri]|uniref:tetrahydrofolate synthase n=1 Tax=Leptomonas seymouri TaxID=5684 RepID=A0A0N0P6C4_LEPSE|nr:folylpolyglutamate synthetase (FPGS) [Leptomonas seymouri]|eukprot:KPI86997.1 folylpolyglutamate synthetase (FPGS) [Leptomonas seymouri]